MNILPFNNWEYRQCKFQWKFNRCLHEFCIVMWHEWFRRIYLACGLKQLKWFASRISSSQNVFHTWIFFNATYTKDKEKLVLWKWLTLNVKNCIINCQSLFADNSIIVGFNWHFSMKRRLSKSDMKKRRYNKVDSIKYIRGICFLSELNICFLDSNNNGFVLHIENIF